MKLSFVTIVSFSKLAFANSVFIPGRGCGTLTPITAAKSLDLVEDGRTCVIIESKDASRERMGRI